ncbi:MULTISPECIES: hypothetical protein [Paenibacillus]|uniref:hypothetical protein n=1 Tax=Paenibacillus TaxID=44249 RepID=UPI00036B432E|nr:hypothetical protein [Paenibacillus terrigena]
MHTLIILAGIALFLIPAFLFVIHIALMIWAFRDASERYQDNTVAWIITAVLFWFPIIGIIVYMFVRKERPQPPQHRFNNQEQYI